MGFALNRGRGYPFSFCLNHGKHGKRGRGGKYEEGYTSSVGGNSDSRLLSLSESRIVADYADRAVYAFVNQRWVFQDKGYTSSVGATSWSRSSYITFCRRELRFPTLFVAQKTTHPIKLTLFNNRLLRIFRIFLPFIPFRDSDKRRGRESEFPPTEEKNGTPNQRRMRAWHSSKSTPNARMAFCGYECHWRHARLACHMIPRRSRIQRIMRLMTKLYILYLSVIVFLA